MDELPERGAPREAALLAEVALDYESAETETQEHSVIWAARLMIRAHLVGEASALLDRAGPLQRPDCRAWAGWIRGVTAQLSGRMVEADVLFAGLRPYTQTLSLQFRRCWIERLFWCNSGE